jgi:hypothetical protein
MFDAQAVNGSKAASMWVPHIERLTKEAGMTRNEPYRGDNPSLAYSKRAIDPWNWPLDAGWSPQRNPVGYHVKATDGNIGKVNMATHTQDDSYLVVNTGPWIFGSALVIPAGLVSVIDHSERNVYLICTKELVKSAPAFKPEPGKPADRMDRDKVAGYYRAELAR